MTREIFACHHGFRNDSGSIYLKKLCSGASLWQKAISMHTNLHMQYPTPQQHNLPLLLGNPENKWENLIWRQNLTSPQRSESLDRHMSWQNRSNLFFMQQVIMFMSPFLFPFPQQTIVHLEGNNKLVAELKGLKSVTEIHGDTLTSVSSWQYWKKIIAYSMWWIPLEFLMELVRANS